MAPGSTPTWAFIAAVGVVAIVIVCVVIAALQLSRRREQRGFPVKPSDSERQTKEPDERE